MAAKRRFPCGSKLPTTTPGKNSHTLDHVLCCINSLQNGYAEGCCLPCTVLSSGKDVSPCQRNRDAFFLYGGRLLKTFLIYSLQQFALQEVILKVVALRCCNVLRRW